MAHMFSALQMQYSHTKRRDKKKWDSDKSMNPLSNAPISNWKKQLTQLQPQTSTSLSYNTYIKYEQWNKKNFVDNNKHNPHTKLLLLNWHNQNPNVTTVQMLIVLLQWLCGEVWEREFSYLWQQRIC